jgi:hypothetical protein
VRFALICDQRWESSSSELELAAGRPESGLRWRGGKIGDRGSLRLENELPRGQGKEAQEPGEWSAEGSRK